MTPNPEDTLALRNRTTLWVSVWTRQRLLHLQQPQETIDEVVARLIDHYHQIVRGANQ